MNIEYGNYNVVKAELGTVTAGTKTEIGTAEEFNKVANLIENSGVMIVGVTVGETYMHGAVLANHYQDATINGIDFGGVTNMGYSPSIIAGSVEVEDGKCYVTMSVTPVSANRTSCTTKSTKA